MPSPSTHPELTHAEALLDELQFREALAIVTHVEEQGNLSPEDQLYCMGLKLEIRGLQWAVEDLLPLSELVYNESCVQENHLFQATLLI